MCQLYIDTVFQVNHYTTATNAEVAYWASWSHMYHIQHIQQKSTVVQCDHTGYTKTCVAVFFNHAATLKLYYTGLCFTISIFWLFILSYIKINILFFKCQFLSNIEKIKGYSVLKYSTSDSELSGVDYLNNSLSGVDYLNNSLSRVDYCK